MSDQARASERVEAKFAAYCEMYRINDIDAETLREMFEDEEAGERSGYHCEW